MVFAEPQISLGEIQITSPAFSSCRHQPTVKVDGDLAVVTNDVGGSGSAYSGGSYSVGPNGTIAFTRGIPLFTTLVALLVDDEPVLGVIDLPAIGDRIHGVRGGGVWRGDERLEVRKPDHLEDAP